MLFRKRIQKRVRGGKQRKKVSSGVIGRTADKVAAEARFLKVSKSFVIAVALADYFDIKEQEKYDE